MRLRILTAAAAACLAAAPAVAADYGVGGYIEPLPFRGPIHDWTGPYIGVHGGYGWAEQEFLYPAPPPFGASGLNGDGGVFGAQAGYQVQLDSNMVFGIEADASYSDFSATALGTTIDNNVLGSLRGRIGYAFDTALIYATGGVALTQTETQFGILSTEDWVVGWTLGGGAELALGDRWSVRGEYLYYSFDDDGSSSGWSDVDTGLDAHVVRAGLNYRFQ